MGFWNFLGDMLLFKWLFGTKRKPHHDSFDSFHNRRDDYHGGGSNSYSSRGYNDCDCGHDCHDSECDHDFDDYDCAHNYDYGNSHDYGNDYGEQDFDDYDDDF